MNRAFSKIWVVVIATILLFGGILAWQYLNNLKMGEKTTSTEEIPTTKMPAMEGEIKQFETITFSYFYKPPKLITNLYQEKFIKTALAADERRECKVAFLRVFIFWENEENELDLTFIAPDGSLKYKAEYEIGPEQPIKTLTIDDPPEGAWTIEVYGKKIIKGEKEDYTVQIYVPGVLMQVHPLMSYQKFPLEWEWNTAKTIDFKVTEMAGMCRLLNVKFEASSFKQENGENIISGDSFSFTPNSFKVDPDGSQIVKATFKPPSDIPLGKYLGEFEIVSGEEKTVLPISIILLPETVEGETANWKTYRNEEYGFEIKYLSNWEFKDAREEIIQELEKNPPPEGTSPRIAPIDLLFTSPDFKDSEGGAQFSLFALEGISPYECEGYPGLKVDIAICPPRSEVIEISGIKAVRLFRKHMGPGMDLWEWFAVFGLEKPPLLMEYYFSLIYNPDKYFQGGEIFNQMLSTFRFKVEVVEKPTLVSVEFNPSLQKGVYYPHEYQSGTIMTLKGKFDEVCLAGSPGPDIEPSCTKFPITRKTENDFDLVEFKLDYSGPLCHRSSDFHEVHFFDKENNLVKIIYCNTLLDYLEDETAD